MREMRSMRNGFTLVELLVVIGIIGILIVALVPVVKGAQVKAKEAAVKAQCSGIESALAAYAQNHGGNYPGVAVDVMAPWADHDLGDPALFAGGGDGPFDAASGVLASGVVGGDGHYNNSSTGVFEQLKTVKDTPLGGAANNTPRYFDSLIASGAIQDYPPNPFVVSTASNTHERMHNVFRFWINVGAGFDPNNPGTGWASQTTYGCGIDTHPGGQVNSSTGGNTITDPLDSSRLFLVNHYPLGVPLAGNYSPESFADACSFGTGENDYFAPGDFAYVPILSNASQPFGDTAATLENETYRWGSTVTGYMLFGYGDKTHKTDEFEDEEREFAKTGLPGYGGPGVDTYYENVVLQCFEGAIYFSKKY
jgi:prepilin-type N-terminal cleavage/methylation domain-containing protein